MKSLSRVAAFGIVGMVALIVLALFHHPVLGGDGDARAEMAQLAAMDNLVHGALIVLLAVLASALAVLSHALSERAGALHVYRLGCMLLGVAMLLDGFVTPQLVGADSVLRAIGVIIQTFSKAGLIAHCAAMLLWSYSAWRRMRSFAIVGAVAAVLPAASILFGSLRLTPHTLLMVFGIHAIWYLSVAWVLYRLDPPSN